MTQLDVEALRKDFPILDRRVRGDRRIPEFLSYPSFPELFDKVRALGYNGAVSAAGAAVAWPIASRERRRQ